MIELMLLMLVDIIMFLGIVFLSLCSIWCGCR